MFFNFTFYYRKTLYQGSLFEFIQLCMLRFMVKFYCVVIFFFVKIDSNLFYKPDIILDQFKLLLCILKGSFLYYPCFITFFHFFKFFINHIGRVFGFFKSFFRILHTWSLTFSDGKWFRSILCNARSLTQDFSKIFTLFNFPFHRFHFKCYV